MGRVRTALKKTWQYLVDRKLVVFIVSAVCVALVLTAVALYLYKTSGSLQLDLSRPGYEEARKETKKEQTDDFPATGQLDKKTLDEFNAQLDKQIKDLETVDAFGGDGMSNAALGIDESTRTE